MFCVLGASGFIGRSMADYLVGQGVAYRALMRDPLAVTRGAFAGAHSIGAFEIGGDMDPGAFDGIDTVLVAGWATKPNVRGNSIANEVQKNILPHSQFLTMLFGTGVKHLIFLSSGGAVYGNADQNGPVSEDHKCEPVTPYGYGKLCIEKAVQGFWRGDGRRYTIIRPSNPVGRHQMLSVGVHGLFPSVTRALVRGEPVQVFGDGSTVRDYFAVEDLAALVLAVALQDKGNQVINASSGRGLSINQVIGLCAEATGEIPQLDFDPARQPVIGFNVLDNSRAHALFGWAPKRAISDVAHDLNAALRAELAQDC